MSLSVIILAGGSGSRMKSAHPKVLHTLAGKPLLAHVIDSVTALNAQNIFVVYGHQGDVVCQAMNGRNNITWVEQKEQLGTGHAVLQVLPYLNRQDQVLILYGDVPLITTNTLHNFIDATGSDRLGLLTAMVDNPSGLGRVVRDDFRQVTGVVEERDASDIQKQIKEINTGIYCVHAEHLHTWLPKLSDQNAQNEYYLTDIVRFAREQHVGISVSRPLRVEEIYGANTRVELSFLERMYQKWQCRDLMLAGVTMRDPDRVDIRGKVSPGQDCIIDVNVVFEGEVVLGKEAKIGANCVIKDTIIGDNVVIEPNSIIEGAVLSEQCVVGPFARIRPNTKIGEYAKVGNFVEVKESTLGAASKVNHLSYLGDTEVGSKVNIGAGVITCNYDGAHKHKTIIEDNVFIGSDCQLVAPVTVEQDATIGAGTTVTQKVTAGKLVVGRCQQQVIDGWQRPKKENK